MSNYLIAKCTQDGNASEIAIPYNNIASASESESQEATRIQLKEAAGNVGSYLVDKSLGDVISGLRSKGILTAIFSAEAPAAGYDRFAVPLNNIASFQSALQQDYRTVNLKQAATQATQYKTQLSVNEINEKITMTKKLYSHDV